MDVNGWPLYLLGGITLLVREKVQALGCCVIYENVTLEGKTRKSCISPFFHFKPIYFKALIKEQRKNEYILCFMNIT